MNIVLYSPAITLVQGARQFARAEQIAAAVDEGAFAAKDLTPVSSRVPSIMHIIAIILYLLECAQNLLTPELEGRACRDWL